MANEAYIMASLSYLDSEGTKVQLDVPIKAANVATKVLACHKQSIATSETTIDLGAVTSMGWVLFVNRDATNYIEIKTAAGGTIIGKMLTGEPYGPVRMGSGVTAPVAIANTAACRMDILILST